MQRVVSIEHYHSKTVVYTTKALTDDAIMQADVEDDDNTTVPILTNRSVTTAPAPAVLVPYESGTNSNSLMQLDAQKQQMMTVQDANNSARRMGARYLSSSNDPSGGSVHQRFLRN
ncbi:MAG: hypothetical protein LBP35_03445 [Candidatus Ancillula trichonymphae]|jgi:hypothetical protein|nr:hypothetical protein [Candidatus Ancillula trichonymphae]